MIVTLILSRVAVPLTEGDPRETPLVNVALMLTLFLPSEPCVTVFEAVPRVCVAPTALETGKSNELVPDVFVPSMVIDQGWLLRLNDRSDVVFIFFR